MQNDWLLEGRAVDDAGNGTTWQWRDADGTTPDRTERVMLESLMRDDFTEVFGHAPTRVAVAWLPSCGVDSLYKLPTYSAALDALPDDDQGRRGIWLVDCEVPDCDSASAERTIGKTPFCVAHAAEAGLRLLGETT